EVGRRKGVGAGESCLGDSEGFAAKGDGSGARIGTKVKSYGVCNGVSLRIRPRGCVEGEPINSAGQIPGAGGLAGVNGQRAAAASIGIGRGSSGNDGESAACSP